MTGSALFIVFLAVGSDPAWMLFLCAILAVSLLVYTFKVPVEFDRGTDKTRLTYLKERKEQVYENLRDLNFEFKAGKFPEADYQQMRASLEDEAAALLAEIERLESAQQNPVFRGFSGSLKKSSPKGANS